MKLNWNPPPIEDQTAIFTWSADHAALVHEGGTTRDDKEYPARPFTTVTIDETDLEASFKDKYQEHQGDVETAFQKTMEDLGDGFKDTIEHHQWDIPSTGRKRHKLAPNWQTIYDSGELSDSQSLDFDSGAPQ